MKILLDENLPLKVNYEFGEKFIVKSVKDLGWEGIKNGKLLQLAIENEFQIFVTMDKNLKDQQNLKKLNIKIILLRAKDNRVDTISLFVPKIKSILEKDFKNKFTEIK